MARLNDLFRVDDVQPAKDSLYRPSVDTALQVIQKRDEAQDQFEAAKNALQEQLKLEFVDNAYESEEARQKYLQYAKALEDITKEGAANPWAMGKLNRKITELRGEMLKDQMSGDIYNLAARKKKDDEWLKQLETVQARDPNLAKMLLNEKEREYLKGYYDNVLVDGNKAWRYNYRPQVNRPDLKTQKSLQLYSQKVADEISKIKPDHYIHHTREFTMAKAIAVALGDLQSDPSYEAYARQMARLGVQGFVKPDKDGNVDWEHGQLVDLTIKDSKGNEALNPDAGYYPELNEVAQILASKQENMTPDQVWLEMYRQSQANARERASRPKEQKQTYSPTFVSQVPSEAWTPEKAEEARQYVENAVNNGGYIDPIKAAAYRMGQEQKLRTIEEANTANKKPITLGDLSTRAASKLSTVDKKVVNGITLLDEDEKKHKNLIFETEPLDIGSLLGISSRFSVKTSREKLLEDIDNALQELENNKEIEKVKIRFELSNGKGNYHKNLTKEELEEIKYTLENEDFIKNSVIKYNNIDLLDLYSNSGLANNGLDLFKKDTFLNIMENAYGLPKVLFQNRYFLTGISQNDMEDFELVSHKAGTKRFQVKNKDVGSIISGLKHFDKELTKINKEKLGNYIDDIDVINFNPEETTVTDLKNQIGYKGGATSVEVFENDSREPLSQEDADKVLAALNDKDLSEGVGVGLGSAQGDISLFVLRKDENGNTVKYRIKPQNEALTNRLISLTGFGLWQRGDENYKPFLDKIANKISTQLGANRQHEHDRTAIYNTFDSKGNEQHFMIVQRAGTQMLEAYPCTQTGALTDERGTVILGGIKKGLEYWRSKFSNPDEVARPLTSNSVRGIVNSVNNVLGTSR